jgi:hypothetical protein
MLEVSLYRGTFGVAVSLTVLFIYTQAIRKSEDMKGHGNSGIAARVVLAAAMGPYSLH